MSKPLFSLTCQSSPLLLICTICRTRADHFPYSLCVDHSWAFQKVNKQIRQALSVLRQQGYTGDGFYSRGRSLNPNYEGNVDALGMHDGPTYTW